MVCEKAASFTKVITCEDLIPMLNGTNDWYLLIQNVKRLFRKDILELTKCIIRFHFETVQNNPLIQ